MTLRYADRATFAQCRRRELVATSLGDQRAALRRDWVGRRVLAGTGRADF